MAIDSVRNQTLDSIRGIAVLIVVIHHTYLPPFVFSNHLSDIVLHSLKTALVFIARGGWTGVDLFFVLSGFLVSGLLFKEYKQKQNVNMGRFLIRRGFKIYPVFCVFIVFTFLFEFISNWLVHKNLLLYYNEHRYWYDITFTTNYLNGRWIHLWSLDIEEHFYLLLAVYFYVLIKKKWLSYKTISVTFLLLLLLTLIARIMGWVYSSGNPFLDMYAQTHIRIDALFCGVVISYIYHNHPEKLNTVYHYRIWLLLTCTGYLISNFILDRYHFKFIPVLSLSLNPVCYGVLIIIALRYDYPWLKKTFLIRLGRVSYALYIWHFFVNQLLECTFPNIENSPVFWFYYLVMYVSISFTVAWITTYSIEIPLLKMRDRYFPSVSPAPVFKGTRGVAYNASKPLL